LLTPTRRTSDGSALDPVPGSASLLADVAATAASLW
jgi:hypothetical protein